MSDEFLSTPNSYLITPNSYLITPISSLLTLSNLLFFFPHDKLST